MEGTPLYMKSLDSEENFVSQKPVCKLKRDRRRWRDSTSCLNETYQKTKRKQEGMLIRVWFCF